MKKEMWIVVFEDGRIVTGSDFETEDDAWKIALGWPDAADIADAKRLGAYAVKAELIFEPPPAPPPPRRSA